MNYPRNFPGTNVDKSSGFFLGNTDFVPTLWTSKGPPCHKKGGGGIQLACIWSVLKELQKGFCSRGIDR